MKFLSRLLLGTIGGLSATGAMTIAMVKLHKQLPQRDKYPLPPKEITAKLLREADTPMRQEAENRMTMLNHFAYGAAGGAAYFLACPKPESHSIPKGVIYGIMVWTGSYLGLLPGFGVLKSATEHSPNRSLLMIAVHLVYGVFLATFTETLMNDHSRPDGALIGKSSAPHKDAK
ncbi:MAG: DUF6789 family protein [Chthoniobacterales bacterium]